MLSPSSVAADSDAEGSTPLSPGCGDASTTEASALLHSRRTTSSQRGSLSNVDEEIEALGTGRFTVMAAIICGLGNAADAVELLAISFIIPNLDDIEADATAQSVLSATVFLGMLLGGLYTGVVSDIIGRKPMLLLSLAVNAVAGAATALMPSWPLIALCRIVAGIGVGGSIPSVFSLMTEYLPTANRGFWINAVAWFWMVGTIYTAGVAWIVFGVLGGSWRVYALLCAIPAALGALLTAALLPESPRFEFLQGNLKRCRAILLYMQHRNGQRGMVLAGGRRLAKPVSGSAVRPPLTGDGGGGAPLMPGAEGDRLWLVEVEAEQGGSTATLTLREALSLGGGGAHGHPPSAGARGGGSTSSDDVQEGGPLMKPTASRRAQAPPVYTGAMPPSTALSSLCRGGCGAQLATSAAAARALFLPSLRRSTILLALVWFGLSFGWYGLNVWIPTLFKAEKVQLDIYADSFLVAAANLPGNVAAALLLDRLGRKHLMSGSILIASATALGMAFASSPAAVVTLACVLNAVSNGGWNALDALSTESFPTRLRTSAMGVLAAAGRLGSIIGQFVFGALVHTSIPLLLTAAASMLLLAAVAGFMLPRETSGAALAGEVEEAGDGAVPTPAGEAAPPPARGEASRV